MSKIVTDDDDPKQTTKNKRATKTQNIPADDRLLVRALQRRLHVGELLLLRRRLDLAHALKGNLLDVLRRHAVVAALLGGHAKALPLLALGRDLFFVFWFLFGVKGLYSARGVLSV